MRIPMRRAPMMRTPTMRTPMRPMCFRGSEKVPELAHLLSRFSLGGIAAACFSG